jgi:hypothetical protein
MVMVTGAGPQSKVITPPAATAATTAADVQPAGVPLPTTRSGLRVSTARASAGTDAPPSGLPGLGSALGFFDALGVGLGLALALGVGPDEATAVAGGGALGEGATKAGAFASAHPDRIKAQVTAAAVAIRALAIGERTARD